MSGLRTSLLRSSALRPSSVRVRLAAALLLQALLVAGAVAPQLSARLTGDELLLEAAPLDPVDPFRGAYVTLDYPGLPQAVDRPHPRGEVFVPLRRAAGSEVWTGGDVVRTAPEEGRYLRCSSDGFGLSCGIESLFASQDRARALEEQLARGAVARVRVDSRGHAAVVELLPAA
jgi:uncharacterized membrane-anchored protein